MKTTLTAHAMRIFLKIFLVGLLALSFTRCGIATSKQLASNLYNGNQTIYVYPVHVLAGSVCKYDKEMAKNIVNYINQKGKVKAVFVDEKQDVYNVWHHNETKMFKNSCKAFSGYINRELKEGEFALEVQLLMNPDETYLGAVHTYLIHKNDTKAVFLNLMNSHHPFYQEVKPVSREDGFKIFCKAYDKNFKTLNQ